MRWIVIATVAALAFPNLASAHKITPISNQTLGKRCNGAGGEMIDPAVCMLPSGATVTCGGKGKNRACDSTAITTNTSSTNTGPFGPAKGSIQPGAPNPSGIGSGPSSLVQAGSRANLAGAKLTH
jgi:hypothetical protein